MASDMISRSALLAEYDRVHVGEPGGARKLMEEAPAVDAIPIDVVAEMLFDLFKDECPCNYNDIDEWLPFVCENTDTCPDVVGNHGCWKQFIKHWRAKKDGGVSNE